MTSINHSHNFYHKTSITRNVIARSEATWQSILRHDSVDVAIHKNVNVIARSVSDVAIHSLEVHTELKQKIIEKYGSTHAFCKACPHLNRSTVYQVLSGKYAGKLLKQIALIQIALLGDKTPIKNVKIHENEILQILQNHKCNHCRLIHKKNCLDCKDKTIKEAHSVYNYISNIL